MKWETKTSSLLQSPDNYFTIDFAKRKKTALKVEKLCKIYIVNRNIQNSLFVDKREVQQ
jgi:hypothetical protein